MGVCANELILVPCFVVAQFAKCVPTFVFCACSLVGRMFESMLCFGFISHQEFFFGLAYQARQGYCAYIHYRM
jgi:hypothetical protein